MIELFATIPETLDLGRVRAYAQRVERMGFDGLYVSDTVHDGLLLAGQALAATVRLRVGISVLVALPRSPMNVAIAAWDLQAFSGGRFELGLGTQIRQNIEERYSARWLPPAAGMREYVAALRAIFHAFRTQTAPDFVGEHFRFTRLQPFFNPGPIDAPDVPIMLGAVGPKMLELTGESADGLHTHPTNTSTRYLRDVVLPRIAAGVRNRSPQLDRPLICANELVATGADVASVAVERERFRDMLAFVFSTPAYWASLELFGWKDLGERLRKMTRAGQWQEMARAFPDHVLDEFLVSGRHEEIPDALASRFGGLVDRLVLPAPADAKDDSAMAICVEEARRRVSRRE